MRLEGSRGWGAAQDFNFETTVLYGDKRRRNIFNNLVVCRIGNSMYVCINCPQLNSNISLLSVGKTSMVCLSG